MKWTTPNKVIAGLTACLCSAILVVWFFLRGINGSPIEASQTIDLPPDYVLKIEGRNILGAVEKAFYASSHGNLHGDGTALTAYKIKTADISLFLERVKECAPGYRWKEKATEFSSIAQVGRLLPEEMRPIPGERLLNGQPATGTPTTEYYFDPKRSIFYVVINTF
jgi:hypothetical protein